jgi:hypothetical protein
VLRRNNGIHAEMRSQTVATSPPLGGASVNFHGRSSDFAGSFLLAGLPGVGHSSVILGVRTCLPLRGSSGISPDSLFILLAEKPWSPYHILGGTVRARPPLVDKWVNRFSNYKGGCVRDGYQT